MSIRLPGRACVIVLALLGGSRAAEAGAGGGPWRAQHLDLDVHPDFAASRLRVSGRMSLELEGRESTLLTLRLGHDLTPYFKAPTQFMRFTSVAAAGARVEMNRSGGKPGLVLAELRFSRARHRGDAVDVRFEAELVQNSFEFVISGSVVMGGSDAGWYPRPAPASEEGWSPQIDATPGLTRLHYPEGWRSVATGAWVARTREGGGWVESWRQDTHRTRAFAVGRYRTAERRIGALDVRVYSLTPAMDPDALVQNLTSILDTLQARFGPYPYSKYAAAEFPDDAVRWWGNALGDFQILRTSLVAASGGGFSPLAHEIGHAWWGNLVESAWPGGHMLGEAMAGYSSLLALEGAFGPDRYRRALHVNEPGNPPDFTLANHFKMIAEGKDVALSRLTPEGPNDYQISLVKGTFFFHMLRRQVGDEVFFATLRRLLEVHAHRTLSLDGMRAAFLEAAPDRGLAPFFEQWLDRTGAPVFESTLTCNVDASGEKLNRLELIQTQPGPAYVLDMKVKLLGHVEQFQVARVRSGRTMLEVEADECFRGVELDPEGDLLIWRPQYAAAPVVP
jgi:hypothetical protein